MNQIKRCGTSIQKSLPTKTVCMNNTKQEVNNNLEDMGTYINEVGMHNG